MISALHLIWIAPVCGAVGFMIAALMNMAHDPKDYK